MLIREFAVLLEACWFVLAVLETFFDNLTVWQTM